MTKTEQAIREVSDRFNQVKSAIIFEMYRKTYEEERKKLEKVAK